MRYPVNEKIVKLLGRSFYKNQTLWLTYSASGFEFKCTGKEISIYLCSDSVILTETKELHFARYAVYVDDILLMDELLVEKEKTIHIHEKSSKVRTIRFIKLSATADSSMGIKAIETDSGIVTPTEKKARLIEFIGDSITCGYGVDSDLQGTYSTSVSNASKSYAYILSSKLDADYSMVCISGHGIISGYTRNGEKQEKMCIPKFYETLGHSEQSLESGLTPQEIRWNFDKQSTNLIIIFLGTNDSSYCGNNEDKMLEFCYGYELFLSKVRKNNQNAAILCTLGTMGAGLNQYIIKAIEKYKDETRDEKVFFCPLEEQNEVDGYAVDFHPSSKTQQKIAEQLYDYINRKALLQ